MSWIFKMNSSIDIAMKGVNYKTVDLTCLFLTLQNSVFILTGAYFLQYFYSVFKL
jgi:hypothetical protein